MILSEARELLFDVVVPTIDSQVNVDKFDRCLNLVQERFINSGKWLGMMKEIVVSSSSGYFTLPRDSLPPLRLRMAGADVPFSSLTAGLLTATGSGS